MVKKQHYFVGRVTRRLQELGIAVTLFVPVAMFDISWMSSKGSRSLSAPRRRPATPSMSTCPPAAGRPRRVTLAAMVHEVPLYYVSADRYATGGGEEECEHGLSIVENVRTEVFQHFRIMMPKPGEVRLSVEPLRRKESGGDGMRARRSSGFFHSIGVHGYERRKLHTAER